MSLTPTKKMMMKTLMMKTSVKNSLMNQMKGVSQHDSSSEGEEMENDDKMKEQTDESDEGSLQRSNFSSEQREDGRSSSSEIEELVKENALNNQLVAQDFSRVKEFATKMIKEQPHYKVYRYAGNHYIPYDSRVGSDGRRLLSKYMIVESLQSIIEDDQAHVEQLPSVQAQLSDIPSSSTSEWHSTIYQILTAFEKLSENENRRVDFDAQQEFAQPNDQTSTEQELLKNSD